MSLVPLNLRPEAMSPSLQYSVVLLAALAVSVARASADVLFLRDGARHSGRVISRSHDFVTFEIILADGSSRVVQRFPVSLVERIESAPPSSQPAAIADSDIAPPEPPAFTPDLARERLVEVFRHIADRQPRFASMKLNAIIRKSPPDVLEFIDAVVRKEHGLSLASLTARTRIDDALTRDQGRMFRLRGVTDYETEELSQLLATRERAVLEQRFGGRSIEQWIDDPHAYHKLLPDAQRMVRDARIAARMISERARIDPTLTHNPTERKRLASVVDKLARFTSHVSNMNGYMSLGDENDPASPAARALRRMRPATVTSRPATGPGAARRLPGSLFDDDEDEDP